MRPGKQNRGNLPGGLWSLSVETSWEAEDAMAAGLGDLTGLAVAVYRDLENGCSRVTVYASKPFGRILAEKVRDEIGQIQRCGLKTGLGRVQIKRVKREDWRESWKKHFPAFTVGDVLLVKPTWSHRKPRRGQAEVILDPGLSFGTGQHPTTGFCLSEVVARRVPGGGSSLLEIGTGTGILALAAVKLDYTHVEGLDFDPVAVKVARENAVLNGVEGKVRFRRANVEALSVPPRRKYDVVCANLMANLLMASREKIVAQALETGALVLAGILRSEFPQVVESFESLGWKCVRARTEKEWRSGSFQRAS